MPANDIILLPNQPIQFYKQIAEVNQRQWDQTAYHKRQGLCFFEGPDYCNPVSNTDQMTFQFKAATKGVDKFLPALTPIATGSATSTSILHLVDSGADFVSAGVDNGFLVLNTTTQEDATVFNVDSATDLELFSNPFTSGDNYEVLPLVVSGVAWNYNMPTGEMAGNDGAGFIELSSALVVGKWYKGTINVTDVSAGNITIFFGNNPVAVIDSVGEHTFYGQCTVTVDFQIIKSIGFNGLFLLNSITIFELETVYTIGVFNLDETYVNSLVHTEDTDSLTIGNVFINEPWDSFNLPCGSYVLGIYKGDVAPCGGQMIQNGSFTEGSSGWTLGTNMSIAGGFVELLDAPSDAILENELLCAIKAGNSYTLTYQVSVVDGFKYGNYTIPQAGAAVRNFTNEGSVSITFTAPGDSDILQILCLEDCKAKIDNFILICNDCALDPNDADSLSECLCVCESHDCTVLIEYNSDRPSFGCYFGGVNMMIRVKGRVRNPETPDIDYDPFKNSMDVQDGQYANLQRKEEFVCTLAPEWVHNTLAVALSHQNVYIDSVKYRRLSNYQPKWGNTIELCEGLGSIAQTDQSNLRSTY